MLLRPERSLKLRSHDSGTGPSDAQWTSVAVVRRLRREVGRLRLRGVSWVYRYWILDILSQPLKAFGDEAIIPSEREEGSIAESSSHTETLLAQKLMTSHINHCTCTLLSSTENVEVSAGRYCVLLRYHCRLCLLVERPNCSVRACRRG